ncbi:MAG: pyridoxal-phosphate dependent enzyme [Proteobacteria bacterium]|nr:pyridoxal-phosphate dependent enzyme [Pseudomonadota bacterium]
MSGERVSHCSPGYVDHPALAHVVRRTPLLAFAAVQARIGRVSLKLENLQRTGSFKLRGAAYKLAGLSQDQRQRGVVAASAGNHGVGVALVGSRLGIATAVVVPETTPPVKRRNIESAGAEVVVDGATYDDAEAIARARASACGAVFVSPFDDDMIICGNGASLAAEIVDQDAGVSQVVCPVGGGGLISGLGMELAGRGIRVIGVQPENNCAMYESFERGRAVTVYRGQPTVAEGCEGPVAERTYRIARQHVDSIALVSEQAIRRAVAFCYRAAGIVVECTAAVALAGFMEGAVEPAATGSTVCILTGGNIEPDLLDEILATEGE